MTQSDLNIANQGFPSFRADLNAALQSIATQSAGATAPTTTYPYQWWYDQTAKALKSRDAANAAWITFATFDEGAGTFTVNGLGPLDSPTFAGLAVNGATNVRNTSNAALNLTSYSGTQNVTGNITLGRGLVSGTSSFMFFQTNDGTSLKNRQRIDGNGDVSFYEETGTTAKFFWDASISSLKLSDSSYSIWGDGSDLKVGHDGTDNIIRSQGPTLNIDSRNTVFRGYSPYTKHMQIVENGDISFYEDTGATAKFFWDASAESLGLGTTTPDAKLEVRTITNIDRSDVEGLLRLTGRSSNEWGALAPSAGTALEFYNSWQGNNPNSVARISGRAEQGYNGGLQFDVSDNTGSGQTNYTTAMNIISNGNVGIGTATPSGDLQVQSSNPDVYITSADTGQSDIFFGGTTTPTKGRIQYSDNSDFMSLWTNSTARLHITSGGNIGIGTTAPSEELEIASSSPTMRLTDTDDATHGAVSYNVGALFLTSDQTVRFNTAGSERVRIDTAGNVGVGTTTPSAKFEAVTNDNTLAAISAYEETIGGEAKIDLKVRNNASNPVTMARVSSDMSAGGAGAEAGDLRFSTISGGTLTERMRIDVAGNVGVGTATPTSKLDVAGTVTATAFAGDGSAITGITSTPISTTGAVGTYAMLARNLNTADIVAGTDYAGGTLVYAGVCGQNSYSYNSALNGGGTSPAGTWRAMGTSTLGVDASKLTLFLRIS